MKINKFEKGNKYKRKHWYAGTYIEINEHGELIDIYLDEPLTLDNINADDWVELR